MNTSADPTKRDEMIAKAGGTWITPTIVVDEEVGLGFDPEWLRVRVRSAQLLEGITPGITVDFTVRPEGTHYVIETIRRTSGG